MGKMIINMQIENYMVNGYFMNHDSVRQEVNMSNAGGILFT